MTKTTPEVIALYKKKYAFNKKRKIFLIVLLSVLLGGVGFVCFNIWIQYKSLQSNSSQLLNLNSYQSDVLNAFNSQIHINTPQSIADLIHIQDQISGQVINYSERLNNLQAPYKYFLEFLYLPSLNIRKNPFNGSIDLTLYGNNYLKKNPFLDSTLLQYRSDFFKNVGNNLPYNDIKNISVSDIQELQNGLFTYSVDVDFVAPTKRSFLMLINRLSLTSDRDSLSTINEFIYHLWMQLRTKVKNTSGSENDVLIGQNLTDSLITKMQSGFITGEDIDKALRSFGSCSDEMSKDLCYYNVRQKMNNVPSMAYTIANSLSADPVKELSNFMRGLPPLIQIKQFYFSVDKNKSQQTQNSYVGSIKIQVYGRGIQPQEVNEIATQLGKKCLGKEVVLDPLKGYQLISDTLTQLSSDQNSDTNGIKDYLDLQKSLTEMNTLYPQLTNFKKILKLFEVFRMLDDYHICTQNNFN